MTASCPSTIRPRAALAMAAFACLAASGARAAADDINAPEPAPVAAPAVPSQQNPVVALGKRVLDSVIAAGNSVVDAFGSSVSNGASPAPGWRLGSAPRPATLAARAEAVAAGAGDPVQAHPAGFSDFSMGAKWRVLHGDADTAVPVVSWMADVQPANAASLAGGSVLRPSVHLSAEWAIAGSWTFGLMPGVAMDLDNEGRRYAYGTMAVTLGREWVPGVNAFVDLARDRVPLEQGGADATTVDAGVSIMTGPSSQVDIAFARGLTPAAPPFQAGLGVSSTF